MNAARSVIVVAPAKVDDAGVSLVISELKGSSGCTDVDTVPEGSFALGVLIVGTGSSEVMVDTT